MNDDPHRDDAWLGITEEMFLSWVLRALRRRGYLVAHVNAVARCACCAHRGCPCVKRAVAKMEPGLPDVIAVSPFADATYPLIVAELKDERGRLSIKRGQSRGRHGRLLPSQRDWANALRIAGQSLTQGRRLPLIGEIWRPHDARRIQETIIHDDGSEREPWSVLDAFEQERKSFGPQE